MAGHNEYQQWEALLNQIGPTRVDQPGVNEDWSFKDLVAHLNGWQPRLIASIPAAQRGEPEPPPPWPAHLQTEDESLAENEPFAAALSRAFARFTVFLGAGKLDGAPILIAAESFARPGTPAGPSPLPPTHYTRTP